jgi:hypothetical protein
MFFLYIYTYTVCRYIGDVTDILDISYFRHVLDYYVVCLDVFEIYNVCDVLGDYGVDMFVPDKRDVMVSLIAAISLMFQMSMMFI